MEETKYQLLHPGAEALVRMLSETMSLVHCPVCGAKICRAAEGSHMTTFCRKCRHLLDIEVCHEQVTIYYSGSTEGALKAKDAQDIKEANKQAATLRRQRKANRNKTLT